MVRSPRAPDSPSATEDPSEAELSDRAVATEAKAEGRGFGPTSPNAAVATVPAPGGRRKQRVFGVAFYLACAWLALIVLCAILSNVLPVQDPNAIDVLSKLEGPFSEGHVLGTDGLGRDILARLVHGARVSVVISLVAVSIGMAVGGTLGMVVGFFRGRIERFIMAIVDVVLAFPGLVLLLALVAYVGQNLRVIATVIGMLSIPIYTRVSRANTLSISQREFVLAARALGATNRRIMFKEIFPNVVLPVMALGLIAMGVVIVLEGSLAFLGLSVKLPQATWGGMIAEGKRHLPTGVAHVAFIPSVVMFLTVLSLNFVGDKLRSRFDVRESSL